MKESVTKFDLEAAFKALDELDVPVAKKGIAANRVNLKETFNRKLKTEALLEDYYDVNDTNDLEQASEDRQAEVAQAKLARIEKIVDLDAETEEDILPSYEGKVIVQCPQCMTLFYKNPEDVEASEDDDTIVNVGEVCQHCGNESGYSVIGKVAAVEPEVEETEEETDELNLDFEEPVDEDSEEEPMEEVSEEEPAEEEASEEELEEVSEEEPEEEKTEESLNSESKTVLTEAADGDAEVEDEVEEEPIEEPEEVVKNEDALDVLKDKIDVHGEDGTIIIAEKGQLDNEEAPKVEVEVSEEESDVLEQEFHEEETEEVVDEESTEEVVEEAIEEESDEEILEEDLTDMKWAPRLDDAFKSFEYIVWKKEDTKGISNGRKEKVKELGNFTSFKEIDKAVQKATKVAGFGDIYGITEDGEKKLIRTYEPGGKDVTKDVLDSADYFDYKKELAKDSDFWVKTKQIAKDAVNKAKEVVADGKAAHQRKLQSKDAEETAKHLDQDKIAGAKNAWAVKCEESGSNKLFTDLQAALDFGKKLSQMFDGTILNAVSNSGNKKVLKNGESLVKFEKGKMVDNNKLVAFTNNLKNKAPKKEEGFETDSDQEQLTEGLDDMDRFEMQQFLEDNLGTEETLAELVNAMSEDQMKDLFEFIAKNHDLDLEENEEIDEALINEDAEVSDAAFKELISSDEYKQPISVAEVSSYWTEDFDEASIEDELDSVEDIEEEELNNVITEALKRVYENVENFTINECTLDNNKFTVNGTVKFNSGNTRQMSYIFNEAKISKKNTDKIILEGINKTLDPEGKFYLESMLTENKTKLVSNKLTYSYHINNNLVEKLK